MDREATAFEIVWRSVWVRAFVYTVAVVLLLWLLWRLRGTYAFALQVAVIGFTIAYILNPLVNALQRLRIGRPLAVVLVYLMLSVGFVFGSVLIGRVIVESGEFIRLIPGAVNTLLLYGQDSVVWLETLQLNLLERLGADPEPGLTTSLVEAAGETVTGFLAEAAMNLRAFLQDLVNFSGGILYAGVLTIVSGTLQVFLIVVTSAYFLYDFPRITASFARYVPLRWRPLYRDLTAKADLAVGGFVRGRLLISFIVGVFIWFGLLLLGVPLALSIAFIAAVLNLIPYLGPIIGAIPAVFLGLTVGPWVAVGAVAVFVGANLLEAHVFGPYIMAKATNLHPVTVLLALLLGAGLMGLVGILLAIPVVALAKVVLEEYLLTRPAFRGPPTSVPEPPLLERKPRADT
ncbi:MAG: AI-2E family transporter [Deinococcota bacterium]|nr:AI-2E family transporter [Deinococcota bacterium]